MTTATIRAATKADEAAVVDVITIAFSTDPLVRWLWRDPPPVSSSYAGPGEGGCG